MLAERILNKSWFYSTVQELFIDTCQRQPNKIAIVFEGEKITYQELHENVNKVSSFLIDLGVEPGDHITVLPTTCPEFVYLYFATLQIGAVYNPLNILWGEDELKAIIERNSPKVIVTVDQYKEKNFISIIKKICEDIKMRKGNDVKQLVAVSSQMKQYKGFEAFSNCQSSTNQIQEIKKRLETQTCTDIQWLCQTSGSTGISKSALLNHRTPLAVANFCAKNMGLTNSDSYLNLAPFFHNSGLNTMNLALAYAGLTLFLMEKFDPKKAVELINENKITATFGFVAHFHGMKQIPHFEEYSFSIKKLILAGDSQHYKVVREMMKGDDVVICTLYGQTEHGGLVSISEHDCMNPYMNQHLNGRPFPGIEVIIKDLVTGERVLDSQPGEIWYRSPFLFKGYYKQPDETKKSFDKEGFFKSGDYGTMENGYVKFMGRLGGVIKSGGENISTFEVNLRLMNLFSDRWEDLQTIGIPDEYWGMKLIAWVRTKTDQEKLTSSEIKEKCKGKLAEFEIPKSFLYWEGDWPVTVEGKINMKKLTETAINKLKGQISTR